MVEFYINDPMDTPDFLIGEQLGGRVIRNLENPFSPSIGSICNYNDNLSVHRSSGVLNKAWVKSVRACESSGCLPLSECVLLVGSLFVYTNIQKLTRFSTFTEAALQTCRTVSEFLLNTPASSACSDVQVKQFVIDGWRTVDVSIDSVACNSVSTPNCPMVPVPAPVPVPVPVPVPTAPAPSPTATVPIPVPAPSPTPADNDCICFSGMATVPVENLGPVPMSELTVGIKVLTTKGFQEIYGFAHFNTTTTTTFLRFQTRDLQSSLEISGEHLVYIMGESQPVRAATVKVGDVLHDEHVGATVTSVDTVTRMGFYAPLTFDGTLIVDGIVSSCYASLQKDARMYVELQGSIATWFSQHFMIHIFFAPVRMFCWGGWCKSYDNSWLDPLVTQGLAVANFADKQRPSVQILFVGIHLLVFGSWFLAEKLCAYAFTLAALMLILLGVSCLLLELPSPFARKQKFYEIDSVVCNG